MKRTLLLLAFYYLLCISSSAQRFDVEYSEPQTNTYGRSKFFAVEGGFVGMDIMGRNVSGMNWNKYRNTATLVRYDQNMKVIKETKLAGGDNVYSNFYCEFKKIGERFWFIYIVPASKNNIGDLMAVEINPITLEPGSPKLLAASGDIDLSVRLVSGGTELKVVTNTSTDKKHTFFCMSTAKDMFYLCCLDENLNVEWSKKEDLPLTEKGIQSNAIDNTGNIYLGYSYESQGYVLVCTKTKRPLNIVIPVAGGKPWDVLLVSNGIGDSIMIVGTYKEGLGSLSGVFTSSISTKDQKKGQSIKKPFPKSVVEQFANDGWGSTSGDNYGLRPSMSPILCQMDNGAINMIAEFRAREVHTTGATFYLSGSILSVCFGSENTSFARIPKYRVSAESLIGDSYYAFPFKNQVIVFYNDYLDNVKKDILLKPGNSNNYKNCVLVAGIVNLDGSITRQIVIDKKDENYLGLPESMSRQSANTLQLTLRKIKGLGNISDISMLSKIVVTE